MTRTSDVEPPKPAAFLKDFVDVDRPRDAVGRMLACGSRWLGRLAGAAGGDAETLLVRISPGAPAPVLSEWVSREVRVRLGRPTTSPTGVMVPLRWEDARRPGLFPVLDGNLEVVSLGPDRSRLVLYASYRPPFDGVGQLLDHAIMHRVAESTARSFLTQVAVTLEEGPEDCDDRDDGAVELAGRRRTAGG